MIRLRIFCVFPTFPLSSTILIWSTKIGPWTFILNFVTRLAMSYRIFLKLPRMTRGHCRSSSRASLLEEVWKKITGWHYTIVTMETVTTVPICNIKLMYILIYLKKNLETLCSKEWLEMMIPEYKYSLITDSHFWWDMGWDISTHSIIITIWECIGQLQPYPGFFFPKHLDFYVIIERSTTCIRSDCILTESYLQLQRIKGVLRLLYPQFTVFCGCAPSHNYQHLFENKQTNKQTNKKQGIFKF